MIFDDDKFFISANCFYFIFRAHIVFAIVDVVKTDFPDCYNDLVNPDIFVHFHYPFYRYLTHIPIPMRILKSFCVSIFSFWDLVLKRLL